MAADDQPVPVFPKPVTLRDVAAAAGVSVATASKALNSQGRMTAETRERIRETARTLGFRPNSLAQSLLRKRSFTVGLLTNDTYGRFSLPLMSGISDALVDNGVSVFLCNVEEDPRLGQLHVEAMLDNGVSVFLCNVEEDPRLGQLHVEAMLDKRVDGIIATGKRIDRHLPVDLSGLRVPVIYAFTQPDPDAVAFVSDDAGGARLAVEHFCRLGRGRIAHVTGPASFAVVHERAQAYRDVLAENGLPVTEPLLGSWSEAWGHQAVAQLFDGKRDRPDGVFCGNDQIARGVIDALREKGLSVPGDVGVIGFDNWEIVAEATRPPLTSVDMNLAALGREAGLTLLSLVGGQPAAPGIRKLPCRLVVRQSCGHPMDG